MFLNLKFYELSFTPGQTDSLFKINLNDEKSIKFSLKNGDFLNSNFSAIHFINSGSRNIDDVYELNNIIIKNFTTFKLFHTSLLSTLILVNISFFDNYDDNGVQLWSCVHIKKLVEMRNIYFKNLSAIDYLFGNSEINENELVLIYNLTFINVYVELSSLAFLYVSSLIIDTFYLENVTLNYTDISLIQYLKIFAKIIILNKFYVVFNKVSCHCFIYKFKQDYSTITFIFLNSNFYGFNSDSEASKILILVGYDIQLSFLENIYISNIECSEKQSLFDYENGVIFIYEIMSYSVHTNKCQIFMKNITFNFIQHCKNGILSLLTQNLIVLDEISFLNTSSKLGTLSIMYINTSLISNIKIKNSISDKYGAINLNTAEKITIINTKVENSYARIGGSIGLKFIGQCLFFNLYLNKSTSETDGGGIISINSNLFLNSSFFYECKSYTNGGIINILSGSLLINFWNSNNSYAEVGGGIYASDLSSFVIMNTIINFSVSILNAITIYSENTFNFVVDNFTISFCYSELGIGNIYIENKNENIYYFYNLNCIYNNLAEATCIYYNAKNNINLNEFYSYGNQGNLLVFLAQNYSIIFFNNSYFKFNSASDNFENLIKFNTISVKINNSYFINNVFPNNFIQFLNCDINISNIFIENNSPNVKNNNINIFSSENCKYYIKNLIYFSNYNFSSSFININNDSLSIYDSLLINGISIEFSLLISTNSNISISQSKFINNIGKKSGSIYCLSSNLSIYNSFFYNNSNLKYDIPDLNNYNVDNFFSISEIFIDSFKFFQFNSFSNTIIEFCHFFNTQGNLIFSNGNFIFYLSNSNFTNFNKKCCVQGIIILNSLNLNISNSSFLDLWFPLGSVFYIESFTEIFTNITIINSSFINSKSNIGGSLYIISDINLIVNNSFFINNKAINREFGIAGVLYHVCYSCEINKILLSKNLFENNLAEKIIANVFSFAIIHSYKNIFKNNYDFYNFSTRFSCFPLKIIFFNFSLFENKTLEINSLIKESNNIESLFFSEKDKNLQIQINNEFLKIISGSEFNFSLIISDYFDQTMNFIDIAQTKILIPEINSSFLIERALTISNNGLLFFKNVKINVSPDLKFLLPLLFSYDPSLNFPFYTYLKLSIPSVFNYYLSKSILIKTFSRPCIIGEIFNKKDLSCMKCSETHYMLKDSMLIQNLECLKCPENAFCPGGNKIIPQEGYWRNSNYSELIIECPIEGSCLGGINELNENEIKGKCAEFHYGPFCFLCENGYAKFSSKHKCALCKDNVFMYVKIVFATLFLIIYIFLQVKITFQANKMNYSGILFKLLMNHLQQISLISMIKLGWTEDFKNIFMIQEYFSFISEEFISVDCLFTEINYNLLAKKIIFSNILPILLSFFFFLWWIISWSLQVFIKKNMQANSFFNRIRVSLLIIVQITYPEILRKCFSLFNCTLIDNYYDIKVLTFSPEVICWEKEHYQYILIGSIPGFITWGFCTPFFILLLLKKFKAQIKANISLYQKNLEKVLEKVKPNAIKPINNIEKNHKDKLFGSIVASKKLSKPIIIEKVQNLSKFKQNYEIEKIEKEFGGLLEFIYKGYGPHFYYWELVIFSKKFILIFVGSFTEMFNEGTKSTMVLVIITFYLFIQARNQPYENYYLNNLEYLSLLVSFLNANIGIMMFTSDLKDIGTFFLIVMIILNLMFFSIWSHYFFKYGLHNIDNINIISYFIKKTKLCFKRKIV